MQHALANLQRHRIPEVQAALTRLQPESDRLRTAVGYDLRQLRSELSTLCDDAAAGEALLADPQWQADGLVRLRLAIRHGSLDVFTAACSTLLRRGPSSRLLRVVADPPVAVPAEPPPQPAGPLDRLPLDGVSPPGGRKVLERRRAILRLVAEHGRVTRSLIVVKLGCAPNTATADLQALEDAGLISRIILGNNLRLSYFEAVS